MSLMSQASQRFDQLGWPTPRLEEWKYTNLGAVATREWNVATNSSPSADISSVTLRDRAVAEYVYIDGVYVADLSTPNPLFVMEPATREQHYARYADYANHPMTALNTSRAP